MLRTCGTTEEPSRRMLKKTRLLTRPTLAVISPSRLSLPRQTLCPGTLLGPSKAAGPLMPFVSPFTFHVSRLLLDIWNLPVNRSQPGIGKVSVDVREAPAPVKLSD